MRRHRFRLQLSVALVASVALSACSAGTTARMTSMTLPKAKPAAVTLPTLQARDDAKMKVHLIDVGQGAATLVEFSCAAVLIDTGGESNKQFDSTAKLKAYLDSFFESRPDLNRTFALVVLTHPHIDHTRAAKLVWGEYQVQNLVTDGMESGSGGKQQAALIKEAHGNGIGVEDVSANNVPSGGLTSPVIDPVRCDDGDPDIRVLWGSVDGMDLDWSDKALKNANNHSVVVRVALGKSSLLVTGDLEEEGIEELLKLHAGAAASALDVDVYEVGHHGSLNGTTKALLEALTPKLALIGVGSNERELMWTAWAYGHPRKAVIELLEAAMNGSTTTRASITKPVGVGAKMFEEETITAPIYATGWDGDVVVTLFGDGRIDVTVSK